MPPGGSRHRLDTSSGTYAPDRSAERHDAGSSCELPWLPIARRFRKRKTIMFIKSFAKSVVVAAGLAALAAGCVSNSEEGSTQEIVDNLVQVGFPANDVQVIDGKVYVGRD